MFFKKRISKIIPSFFTIKEGSPSHHGPLSSGAREKTALLGARNRYALRLADHQRSAPSFAGWNRLGNTETNINSKDTIPCQWRITFSCRANSHILKLHVHHTYSSKATSVSYRIIVSVTTSFSQ